MITDVRAKWRSKNGVILSSKNRVIFQGRFQGQKWGHFWGQKWGHFWGSKMGSFLESILSPNPFLGPNPFRSRKSPTLGPPYEKIRNHRHPGSGFLPKSDFSTKMSKNGDFGKFSGKIWDFGSRPQKWGPAGSENEVRFLGSKMGSFLGSILGGPK